MHTGPWESTKKKKKKISFLLDIFLFTISISIKKSTKLAIFIRYFILRQQRVTRILDKISGKILLLLKKNSRENWRLEQPAPPSGNPSLGVSLACVSFRWDLGGCPRRFATRFIGRLFIFARFSVEGVEGGRYQGVDRYLNFALWSEVERFAGLNGPSVCTRERDTRGLSLPQRNTLLYTVHWHRSLSNRCTVYGWRSVDVKPHRLRPF